MKYNRVYIAGAGGMLGTYVKNAFTDANILATDIDVNEDWLVYGDVKDYNYISNQITEFKPDIIINLAAMTDLEQCEVDYANCFMTNTMGAIHLQEISKQLNVPYVFISTAGVFGGEKEHFNDDDLTNPLSIYAKSKVFAENYLLKNYNNTWIFRAGWMMGGGRRKDKKFVNKIIKQIDFGAKELFVVNDKAGTPTYANDFALSIKRHAETLLPFGLYNMVSSGDASRYDVACFIVSELGLDVKVTSVSSDYFNQSYFAPRPQSEQLINHKLNATNKNYMRDWKVSLKEYLQTFKD